MKKNKLLLASAILGTAYLFYIVYYFFNSVMTASDPLEAIGAGIATALVAPHMLSCSLPLFSTGSVLQPGVL
jgi:hypothetical protein